MEQLRAFRGDVLVNPGSRRQKCQQYQQSADATTTGSESRLMVARIIKSPMAGLQLSPRQQDHEEASGNQSQSRPPSHRQMLSVELK
jgi:hypothetical protein